MKKMTVLAALAVGLQSISASADSLRIDNATIMTMGGMGTLQSADILIEDGKITAIGSDLSEGADRVIDANGAIITPTMFAGATTTGLVEVNAVRESVDSSVSETPLSKLHVEFDVRRAYSPLSSLHAITRTEGFGYTLLAATGGQYSIAGVGSLVDFDGGFDSFSGTTRYSLTLTATPREKWVVLGLHTGCCLRALWLISMGAPVNRSTSPRQVAVF